MKNSLGKIRFLFLSLSVAAVLWFAQTDFVRAAIVSWDSGAGTNSWNAALKQKAYKLKASGCVDKKTLLRLNQLLQK